MSKQSYQAGNLTKTTYYVRDASGNLMSTYEKEGNAALAQTEVPVYGASRLGLYNKQDNSTDYELKDHLGNVRAIISKPVTDEIGVDVKYYADYYPYGSIARSAGMPSRYGYQGEFAEHEINETGYVAFELRQYDPVVGRWLSTDPYGQYASPYLGMGNNPISFIDPDGGFDTKHGAWLYKTFNGGGAIGGNKLDGFTVTRVLNDGDLSQGRLNSVEIISGRPGDNFAQNLYNSPVGRAAFPDFIYVGGGFTGIAGIGGGTSIEANWITRGPDASLYPTFTATQALGAGMAVDATINIGGFNYLGTVNNIRKTLLQTSTPNGDFPTIWGTAGVEAGIVVGVHGSYTRTAIGESIIGRGVNIGIGFPSIGRGAGGISNTWILNK